MEVLLADGVFPLQHTLVLGADDSGGESAPVCWAALPGCAPVISGGRRLHPTWRPYRGDIQVADIGADLDFDQLFVDGQRQVLARYPNVQPGQRLDGYAADAIAPERVATWTDPTTALVRALHDKEWGGNSYRVVGVNPDGSPRLHWVGDNQRGSQPHPHFRMVENVREELDSPAEWFYDRDTGELFYWPADGVDLDNAEVFTAELDELIRVEGECYARPAHDITLAGLTFTHTHRTLFNSSYEPVSLSDWAIVRKGAVRLHNTERVTVRDTAFVAVGGNALFVDGYADEIVIADNRFDGSGASDVAIVGSESAARQASTWANQVNTMIDMTPGPRTQDYPRAIMVSGNVMTRMGRFEKQSAGVQIARAAHVTVSHNTIHDGPRAGINIGDGTWGGHQVVGNDLWNLVTETGDHGPINTWGRDRFWPITDATDAQRKGWSTLDHLEPTIIEGNRIRHDSEWAVDLDDGSSNYLVAHNLFLNSGTKFREGFRRISRGNVYVNGGVHLHASYADSEDVIEQNILLTKMPYHHIRSDPAVTKVRYDDNVFFSDGEQVSGVDDRWRAEGHDVHSVIADPQFLGSSPWVDAAKPDVIVADTSPALRLGFRQLALDSVGSPLSDARPQA